MNLTETPEVTSWPSTHYVYIEKIGPFMETAPKSWTDLHQLIPTISESNKIVGYFSLYKGKEQIYRAGVAIDSPAQNLPDGVDYTVFPGGKYVKFVLTGAFSEIPDACERAYQIVDEQKIAMTDNFSIEHYVTDPRTTPENENIIEIMGPIG